MATKGGSGTFLQTPGDDNVAPVIPLRQRQGEPSEASTPRKPLPRERAAFDPELEPADVLLRRRRPRRAAWGRVQHATARLHVRPRPMVTAAALAAMAMAGAAAAVLGPPFTSDGPRHSPVAARRATAQVVQTQMTQASADKTRYLLMRRTTGTHRARLTHDRTRTPKAARRAASTARHRTHPKGTSTRPTTTATAGGLATGQPAGLSDTQSSPASSPSSDAGSDSGSAGTTSATHGSAADQSPKLPAGPTGVGSANGCNPKCS